MRLEPVESGAASNAHPHRIAAEQLASLLSALEADGNLALSGEASVFTEDQAASLGRDLSAALAKARPDQDVTFQSGGRRGIFGDFSRPSYTTGRMFVHEGRLNLILGVVQELPDSDDVSLTLPNDFLYPVGKRAKRVEKGWDLRPGAGQLENKRSDWLSFALESDPAATVQDSTSASPEQPQFDEARPPEPDQAVQRLQVLEDLKSKGLITEQEYRDKRQQILDDL